MDSTTYCWGYNFDGALGDSTTTSRATPAAVHGARKYTALSAKHEHACAIAADSLAYCWGRNFLGELGTGDTTTGRRLIPSAIAGGLKFASISAGSLHSCAVTPGGAAYCWGYGGEGQLGSTPTDLCGQFPCSPSPQPVAGGHTFAVIAAGNSHTCGITVAGVTYCWGTSGAGALGADAVLQSQTPVRVVGQP
jgi:alpha-tubulin suppressor-like RCC1 family protein